jgi:hypothetical protein
VVAVLDRADDAAPLAGDLEEAEVLAQLRVQLGRPLVEAVEHVAAAVAAEAGQRAHRDLEREVGLAAARPSQDHHEDRPRVGVAQPAVEQEVEPVDVGGEPVVGAHGAMLLLSQSGARLDRSKTIGRRFLPPPPPRKMRGAGRLRTEP